MHIRPFRPTDAEALAALYHAAVHHGGVRDYSAAQVSAWSPAPRSADAYVAQSTHRVFLVAVNEDEEPIGYGDLEPNGHIDHIYCRPDYVGMGVGAALYSALEEAAKAAQIELLFVEASEAARRLFERRGFETEHRREFEVEGVAIHNYRMTKRLASNAEEHAPLSTLDPD